MKLFFIGLKMSYSNLPNELLLKIFQSMSDIDRINLYSADPSLWLGGGNYRRLRLDLDDYYSMEQVESITQFILDSWSQWLPPTSDRRRDWFTPSPILVNLVVEPDAPRTRPGVAKTITPRSTTIPYSDGTPLDFFISDLTISTSQIPLIINFPLLDTIKLIFDDYPNSVPWKHLSRLRKIIIVGQQNILDLNRFKLHQAPNMDILELDDIAGLVPLKTPLVRLRRLIFPRTNFTPAGFPLLTSLSLVGSRSALLPTNLTSLNLSRTEIPLHSLPPMPQLKIFLALDTDVSGLYGRRNDFPQLEALVIDEYSFNEPEFESVIGVGTALRFLFPNPEEYLEVVRLPNLIPQVGDFYWAINSLFQQLVDRNLITFVQSSPIIRDTLERHLDYPWMAELHRDLFGGTFSDSLTPSEHSSMASQPHSIRDILLMLLDIWTQNGYDIPGTYRRVWTFLSRYSVSETLTSVSMVQLLEANLQLQLLVNLPIEDPQRDILLDEIERFDGIRFYRVAQNIWSIRNLVGSLDREIHLI